MRRVVGALLLIVTCVPAVHGSDISELLGPARTALAAVQQQLQKDNQSAIDSEQQTVQRAGLLLRTGQLEQASKLIETVAGGSIEARIMAARVSLAVRDYRRAGTLIDELGHQHKDDPRVRDQVYRWWELRGDIGPLETELREREARGPLSFVDRIHAADLKLRLLDYAGAYAAYSEILKLDLKPADRGRSLRGLGMALYHLQRFDESLARLKESLALEPLDAGTITCIADTLLRLGRVEDAVDVLTFAIEISPQNDRAHILLGSGFTRRNYTQLLRTYPINFSNERGQEVLRKGDRTLQNRRVDEARKIYQNLANRHAAWADVEVRLGSLEYSERNFAAARDHYLKALTLCPDYGRAHEGLARSLQAMDLQINLHYAEDEAALQAAATPAIPNIQRYVINWRSLSASHQKRLALSLEPWARYVPVLVEGGATLYVKPPYQLLSDAPHQQRLRDKRIDYDSRLWDDVRGNGGHNSVVSIEDLETRISNGYDTVLHEVSHQVHALLSAHWRHNIQTLYASAMRRQKTSGNAFLSQYAASSDWEYFAEGANSLHTPRRDRFDTKEIVLERLQALDPDLLALTQEVMERADVGPSYAMAFIQQGNQRLSRGKPREADRFYTRALKHSPGDESATLAKIRVLLILGHRQAALELATSASVMLPQSGAVLAQFAEVRRFCGQKSVDVITSLEQQRAAIVTDEQYLVDLQIGRLHLIAGNSAEARRSFTAALNYQPDDPHALAGLAAAEALAGDWNSAWMHYDQGMRIRAGDIELRLSYARDLMRAGQTQRAQQQLDAALLLDPDNPEALAIQAWRFMLNNDIEASRKAALRAHQLAPWSTLAIAVASTVERRTGRTEEAENLIRPIYKRLRTHAPPEFKYVSRMSRYDLVYDFSAVDIEIMTQMKEATSSAATP